MPRPSVFGPTFFIVLLAGLALLASADTYSGPAYDLVLPDGWVQIPQDVIQRTMQQVSSGGSGGGFKFDAGFQLKGQTWFAYPYVLVQTIAYPKEPSEAEMRSLITQIAGSQLMDQAKLQLSPAAQKIVSNMSVKPGELDTTH